MPADFLLLAVLPDWSTCAACARSALCWAIVTGSLVLWILLPRSTSRPTTWCGRLLARCGPSWLKQTFVAIASIVSLGLFAAALPRLGNVTADVVFWLLAAVAIVAAAAAICMRSPVYTAIWFALSLLSTGGLFLLQQAQFLAVATIVVYAGAIVVTFLFVIMLAQPEGHAVYDRITWGRIPKFVSVAAAASLVAVLTMAVVNLSGTPVRTIDGGTAQLSPTPSESNPTESDRNPVLHPDHMARLGAELFSRHLISVEVAGTLLLVALVGAVAIVIQGKERRYGEGSRRG